MHMILRGQVHAKGRACAHMCMIALMCPCVHVHARKTDRDNGTRAHAQTWT